MRSRKATFEDFSAQVKRTGKKVIVYGAGMIGQIAAPYWLCYYGLEHAVLCYVDADPYKQGQSVQVGPRNVPVQSLSVLDEVCGQYILLVTVSAFGPIVRALEQIPGTKEAEAYFLPIMLLDIAHTPKEGGVIRTSDTPLIPKMIHYCWFGGGPIPVELQRYMDTWKRFCPDYEIVRWDESNYDIHKFPYMEQAYAHKKWGFIPDIARLDILYQYGGIYLDTDVELLRNLDELLYQPAFCSVETWGTVNTGGCSGARPEDPLIREMLDHRKDIRFVDEDGRLNLMTCGYYETALLEKHGLKINGETQRIEDGAMTVYASEFFHPFDYMSGEAKITKNTFSIHHFGGSWLSGKAAEERNRTKRRYKRFVDGLEE